MGMGRKKRPKEVTKETEKKHIEVKLNEEQGEKNREDEKKGKKEKNI